MTTHPATTVPDGLLNVLLTAQAAAPVELLPLLKDQSVTSDRVAELVLAALDPNDPRADEIVDSMLFDEDRGSLRADLLLRRGVAAADLVAILTSMPEPQARAARTTVARQHHDPALLGALLARWPDLATDVLGNTAGATLHVRAAQLLVANANPQDSEDISYCALALTAGRWTLPAEHNATVLTAVAGMPEPWALPVVRAVFMLEQHQHAGPRAAAASSYLLAEMPTLPVDERGTLALSQRPDLVAAWDVACRGGSEPDRRRVADWVRAHATVVDLGRGAPGLVHDPRVEMGLPVPARDVPVAALESLPRAVAVEVVELLRRELDDDQSAWATACALWDSFTGTVGELAGTARAVTGARDAS